MVNKNIVISNEVRDIAPIQTQPDDYGRSLPSVEMTAS